MSKKSSIALEFSPAVAERIESIRMRIGAEDALDVIRRSLAFFDTVLVRVERFDTVLVRVERGEIVILVKGDGWGKAITEMVRGK